MIVSDAPPEPLLLMTPGPTRVPERVMRAGSQPMMHHRTLAFSRQLADAIELLRPVFGTRTAALPVHTTGRGALEATICNMFSAGDQIAVCCNGKFGEMWAGLAASYGVIVHHWSTSWEDQCDVDELETLLGEHRGIRAVALTFGDTSTGGTNDVATVARVAARHGALVLVDAVSTLGGMRLDFDDWGVDVAVTASQKCLMSAPGLAWVAMSERAWPAAARARLPRNYWDFADIRRSIGKPNPETPGTPPVQVVLQVAEALRMMHEEGLENVYSRHDAMATRVRAGAAALGLHLQCNALTQYSSTMTAIALPPPIAPKTLRDKLKARGILTAAALGPYQDRGFRIGHMGDIRMADVERTLLALVESLQEMPSEQ